MTLTAASSVAWFYRRKHQHRLGDEKGEQKQPNPNQRKIEAISFHFRYLWRWSRVLRVREVAECVDLDLRSRLLDPRGEGCAQEVEREERVRVNFRERSRGEGEGAGCVREGAWLAPASNQRSAARMSASVSSRTKSKYLGARYSYASSTWNCTAAAAASVPEEGLVSAAMDGQNSRVRSARARVLSLSLSRSGCGGV